MTRAYDLILKKLDKITYEIIEHQKITNAEEGLEIFKEKNCFKTLAFQNKDTIYLVLLQADDKLDYKKLANYLEINRSNIKKVDISLLEKYGYDYGSIGPIPINSKMISIIDNKVLEYEEIICGIGINTKSLKIKTNDLLKISEGNIVEIRR